jgi:hypothetical protein
MLHTVTGRFVGVPLFQPKNAAERKAWKEGRKAYEILEIRFLPTFKMHAKQWFGICV